MIIMTPDLALVRRGLTTRVSPNQGAFSIVDLATRDLLDIYKDVYGTDTNPLRTMMSRSLRTS